MTTKVTKIDRPTHRLIAERIEKTLVDLGNELGIDFSRAGGEFSDGGSGKFKIEAIVRDTGNGVSGNEAAYRRGAIANRIDPDTYGLKMFARGKWWILEDYSASSPVYPFLAREENGTRRLKFQAQAIRTAFPSKAA